MNLSLKLNSLKQPVILLKMKYTEWKDTCYCLPQQCSDEVTSVDEQLTRALMESAYRLVHCLCPQFIRTFKWRSFLAGIESCDLTVKWSVVILLNLAHFVVVIFMIYSLCISHTYSCSRGTLVQWVTSIHCFTGIASDHLFNVWYHAIACESSLNVP